VLEVVSWDPQKAEAIVVSGFGKRSNWYLNELALLTFSRWSATNKLLAPEIRRRSALEPSAAQAPDVSRTRSYSATAVQAKVNTITIKAFACSARSLAALDFGGER
jgi:hypothetical protein